MTDLSLKIQQAYPQAFSVLQSHLQDWSLAEDCLQDAVEKALINWPTNMPANPTAWLITAAKNKAIDHYRKAQKHQSMDDDEFAERPLVEELTVADEHLVQSLGDDVIRLMFSCCHPELDTATQLALTLKHVVGFSTFEVSRALLVSEKTMEQRLTRAKKKLSNAQLPFDLNRHADFKERFAVVLQVIYLMYNEGYSASTGEEVVREDLSNEAIRLARWLHTLVRHKPDRDYAELIGLLALMVSQQARAPARTDANGEWVILEDQNRALWRRNQIIEGQVLTEKALSLGYVGPFQIQAAISALHNQAANYTDTDWNQIRLLYQALLRQHDTPVIRLNYGMALNHVFGAQAGLDFIETLTEPLKDYLPFHAARGTLLKTLGRAEDARLAFERAHALADNAQTQVHFLGEISKI